MQRRLLPLPSTIHSNFCNKFVILPRKLLKKLLNKLQKIPGICVFCFNTTNWAFVFPSVTNIYLFIKKFHNPVMWKN